MNILLVFLMLIIIFVIVFYYEYKIRNLSAKSKNNVHFYVARDKDKTLWLYLGKPIREEEYGDFRPNELGNTIRGGYHFKHFGLNINDFKDLEWEDEPVEVFINMED